MQTSVMEQNLIFKDFLDKDALLLEGLNSKGFFRTQSLPSVVMGLDFKDFDGYLNSLSHNCRKDLRRKLKRADSQGALRVDTASNVEAIADKVYRLYLNTYESGTVKFEKLTPDFFINIARRLKDKVIFYLYYAGGELAAFNLCFIDGETLIDKFIGFDYSLARKYNLYFFSWCYNVRWCLEKGMRYYQLGQTHYGPKLKLGGKIIPLFAYLKHRNIFMHQFLKICARICGPETMVKKIKPDAE